jgi:hypothetical protein
MAETSFVRTFSNFTAATISQVESPPGSYPAVPTGLSTAAAALPPEMVWSRIEAYTVFRYTARPVVWVAQGEGDWRPNLTPATISLVERWSNNAWITETTLLPSALGGYELLADTYRFTASVGSGTPPQSFLEAFRRLSEYMASDTDIAGASSFKLDLGGGALVSEYQRNPAWQAKALIQSGAADLLRAYRVVP